MRTTSVKILLTVLMPAFLFCKNLQAQNLFPSSGSAGIGTNAPDASSALEIKSTAKGLLISRMSKTQRDAITNPATGLMIYQNNSTPGFYYYDGSAWKAIIQKSKDWALAGNAGTNSANDFLGTTDAQPLVFKVYNQKAGLLEYTASGNTGFGYQNLNYNTGTYNSAFGYLSLFSNTTGGYNVANGYKALFSNSSGYANTATGFQTLFSNTGGILNTGTGSEALFYNTSGSYNTATGYQSLHLNTTGADNTATGISAMRQNTTGSYNTATGRDALYNNTTGNYNTAHGNSALYSNTTGNYNTATGWNALRANTTAIQNTANGFDALASNTTGEGNTSTGYAALIFNTTGNNNTANGAFSLYNNTTGNYNTANGYLALNSNSTGTSNIANGYQALRYNTTGSTNIAIGTNSGFSNTTGYGNTATGFQALYSNTTGYYNTVSGYNAAYYDAATFNNTEIGSFAGNGVANGDGNTYVGYSAGPASAGIGNSCAFGQYATPMGSNAIRIGSASITSIGGQVGWTTFSDGRFKKNIKENVPGLEFIIQLHPITYSLDISGLNKKSGVDKKISLANEKARSTENAAITLQEKVIYTGFIAQDVEKAAKKLSYDFSGVDAPENENDLYGLRYAEFVPPLVKAVQELSKLNDDKDAKIINLQTQIDELKALVISGHQSIPLNDKLQTVNISSASINQNIPNPFNRSTTINYTLPQQYSSARIIITDKSGKALRQVNISGSGRESIKIDGAVLRSGAYQYSFYIDGNLVDTKQMMLIK